MTSLAVIYVILLFIFSFLFLVDCIPYRRRLNLYVKYGLLYGVILVMLDGAFFLLNPAIVELVPVPQLVILDVVALVRIAIFTCMGMYCCALLNCPDLPLTRRILIEEIHPDLQSGADHVEGFFFRSDRILSPSGTCAYDQLCPPNPISDTINPVRPNFRLFTSGSTFLA